MPPKAAKKKVGASGYRMPEHLSEGTVLTDVGKRQWTLGKSIGMGGFGEIYLVEEGSSTIVNDSARYVVKIEPKENGPLFVEMHFYLQVGTPDHVKGWGRKVNMPQLRGNGSYQHHSDTYRFLVIDRFGQDLEKTFENGRHPLPLSTAGTLAVQIINTLEYIHSKGYTHNDVKAANLLMGLGKDSGNVYLVDFGLCVKYFKQDEHKEYKADPKKAHDGTIEYLSRDAHIGCTGRRSDLEVLCFNLLHWMTGSLPWLKHLSSPEKVKAEKELFMSNLGPNTASLPKPVQQLFHYVQDLPFQAKPDYEKCRKFFSAEMKESGGKVNLAFKSSSSPKKTPRRSSPVKKTPVVNGKKRVTKGGNVDSPARGGRKGRVAPTALQNGSSESESGSELLSPSPQAVRKVATPATKRKAATPATKGNVATPGSKRKASAATTPKYKEMACQTSPGFVAKAVASKKGVKSSPAKAKPSPVSKALSPAAKLKPQPIKKSKLIGGASDSSPEMTKLTPAMIAVMKRKQEVADEKANKKKKKA